MSRASRFAQSAPFIVIAIPIIAMSIWLVLVAAILASQIAFADQPDLVTRGEYLARAGDCFSCHTKDGGALLAGGRQVQTPFGGISSPNITPDKETGIGNWTDDDFYRVMHDGIDRQGNYVYPVMPFDHYTKVTREDALAIKAYLFSLQPVHAPPEASHLMFPYNIRPALAAWRALFFKPGGFQPDPTRSAEENRGAYLVEGLGHCGACHTPHNLLGSTKQADALGGGEIKGQGWFAPNISSDVRQGIGSWSDQQLVDYLKTGIAPGRAIVAGPMQEVVRTSLQFLTDADLHAISAYLKGAPPKSLFSEQQSGRTAAAGAEDYLTYCGYCHQPDGRGLASAVPPLAGNGTVMAGGPQNVIRTILGGMPAKGDYAPMPGMATVLTAPQIADIANFVRTSFGNAAPATATGDMVAKISKEETTMLAGTAGCRPVGPPSVANLIAGIEPMLQQVNQLNMLDQIDEILTRLKSAGAVVPQADLVNGLTAAYCPIAMGQTQVKPEQRLHTLQQFSILLYSRLRQTRDEVHAQGLLKASPAPSAESRN